MYPKKTNEAPVLTTAQSGHEYRECSNKGVCDRETGVCGCFDAYEGSACQRASCPNECSGHGVCNTVRELALVDYSNTYELWDADKGLACKCDAGYSGYDCSERTCPIGIDPLYSDLVPVGSAKYPTWAFIVQPGAGTVVGDARFRFYDATGEDWLTEPVTLTSGTLAVDVEDAFKNLPNDVVTDVACSATLPDPYLAKRTATPTPTPTPTPTSADWLPLPTGANAKVVWCEFKSNPGAHRMPEIVIQDRAARYTARASGSTFETPNVKAFVEDLGVASNVDYFGTYCGDGVTLITVTNIASAFGGSSQAYSPISSVTLGGTLSTPAKQLAALQNCLGDSDGIPKDSGLEWDTGNSVSDSTTGHKYPGEFPHLVKLVDTITNNNYNAIVYYDDDPSTPVWRLVNHVPDGTYKVYATAGVLARTYKETVADRPFIPATTVPTPTPSFPAVPVSFTLYTPPYSTPTVAAVDVMAAITTTAFSNEVTANIDISCKTANAFPAGVVLNQVQHCIEKGSLVVIPSTLLATTASTGYTGTGAGMKDDGTAGGTPTTTLALGGVYTLTANLYEVKSITSDSTGSVIKLDRAVPFSTPANSPFFLPAPLYKFTPAPLNKGAYVYAEECSTRGLCNRETGICKCFKGYTNDNCDTQSALAM